jgi:SAM-dependent methyltransferase
MQNVILTTPSQESISSRFQAARDAAIDGHFRSAAILCRELQHTSPTPAGYWLLVLSEQAAVRRDDAQRATVASKTWRDGLDEGLNLLEAGEYEAARGALEPVAAAFLDGPALTSLARLQDCFVAPRAGVATTLDAVCLWRLLHERGYFTHHGKYQDRHHDLGVATIQRLLALSPDDEILDLGCGYGRLLFHLLPLVRRATGIDHATPITAAREFLAGRGAVALVQNDGLTLWPVPTASVDAAVSLTVFQHLTRAGVRSYLHELRRVVRPGGRICVQFHTGGDTQAELLADDREQSLSYSPTQIVSLAEDAGLVFERLELERLPRHGVNWLWLLATTPSHDQRAS